MERNLEMLVHGYLEPEALWFETFVDLRERSIFVTANRNYLEVDEPGRPIDAALEPILDRLDAQDPSLIVVPRMSNEERARHLEEFTATIVDPTVRASFDRRARAMRERWSDHWRPGSFYALANDLPVAEAWHARLMASADYSI